MKPTPLLFLLIFCAAAHAQPIYRCIDGAGRLAFQDHACAAQQVAPPPSVHVAYADESGGTQGGWTNQQRWQRRRQAKVEWRAESLRVGQLRQPESDRRAASYASSNHRCMLVQQIASLCGSEARP